MKFLLVLILLTAPGSALAQHAVACDRHPDCSRELVEAQQQFVQGELELALSAIQSLHDKYQDPRLLYSIARILHHLNRHDDAVPIYRRFLESGAESDPQMLAKTRRLLTEAEARAPTPTPTATPSPQLSAEQFPSGATEAPRPEPRAESGQSGDELSPANVEHRSTAGRPIYKRVWFWSLIGSLATATIVAGVAVGLTVSLAPPSNTRDLRWISTTSP